MDSLYEVDLYGRRTAGHPGGPASTILFRSLIAAQSRTSCAPTTSTACSAVPSARPALERPRRLASRRQKPTPPHLRFCEYCAAKAAKQGIDFDRVKQAFLALEPYVRNGRAGKRPLDGYYSSSGASSSAIPNSSSGNPSGLTYARDAARIFRARKIPPTRHPHRLPHLAEHLVQPHLPRRKDYHPTPSLPTSSSPPLRQPRRERMASFVDSLTQNVFGDLTRQQMLDFEYSVMDFKESPTPNIGRPESDYESSSTSSHQRHPRRFL